MMHSLYQRDCVEEVFRVTRFHRPPARNWGTTQSASQRIMGMLSKQTRRSAVLAS